jgi:hypothetical protein
LGVARALTRDLHIGLVHLPAVSHGVAAWPGGSAGSGVKRGTHRVDRDVVDLDTALGEELLGGTGGQAEALVPADLEDDRVGGTRKPAKA